MFRVVIKIKRPNHTEIALDSEFSTRDALAKFLRDFRKARRRVPRSSISVFGMIYKRGSLSWIAAHNCEILIGYPRPPYIRHFHFKSPAGLPRAGIKF